VTRGAPKGLVKRFLDFIAAPEGQKVLVHRGVIPL